MLDIKQPWKSGCLLISKGIDKKKGKSMTKTTYEQQVKMAEQSLKEMGLDRDKTYEQRDKEVMKLTRAFYEQIGLGVEGEFVAIGDFDGFDVGMYEEAEKEAKMIEGWAEYLGEETETFWKDGKEVGSMTVCCRGDQYWTRMVIGSETWESVDGKNGNWIKK